jgi:hypothetical protein
VSESLSKQCENPETSKLNTVCHHYQLAAQAAASNSSLRWLRVPDLNPSIDGVVQLISSTADIIMAHNAHRRRSKPPIVRLRYPSLGESVMSFAFDCQ